MKKHRLAAAGLALALAAGSVAVAAPALAADVYVSGDITAVEGSSYPAGWFTGTGPAAAATPHGTDAGLEITGRTILLYGQTTDITGGAQLTSLLNSAAVDATGITTFQIPMFWDSTGDNKIFTTLRPAGDGTWITSRAIPDFAAAGEAVPVEDWAALADELTDPENEFQIVPQILAFGVIVNEGDEAIVRSISFAGDNYIFTKAPAAPVANPVQRPATFTG